MKKINLRELYPDVYKTDHFVEVAEDVLETIRAAERAEAAYERKMYINSCHTLCKKGLKKSLIYREENFTAKLRGKIDVNRNIKHMEDSYIPMVTHEYGAYQYRDFVNKRVYRARELARQARFEYGETPRIRRSYR